jgi:hypothetical protein
MKGGGKSISARAVFVCFGRRGARRGRGHASIPESRNGTVQPSSHGEGSSVQLGLFCAAATTTHGVSRKKKDAWGPSPVTQSHGNTWLVHTYFGFFAKQSFHEKLVVSKLNVQIKFGLDFGVSYDKIYKIRSHLIIFEIKLCLPVLQNIGRFVEKNVCQNL